MPNLPRVGTSLPNSSDAIIDPGKLTNYALNPNHPVGGNKARVFDSALGYNQTNADDLINKIRSNVGHYSAQMGAMDNFGQRYIVDIPITGPNGNTATVRTAWIILLGETTSRLTTLYVK